MIEQQASGGPKSACCARSELSAPSASVGVAPFSRGALAALAVLLAAIAGPTARAATFFSPFATIGVEHNSNVFMRPSSEPPFASSGITALGDTITHYEAGVDAEFDWGPQRLTLKGEGTRDDYNRFSFLDHTEYDFGAHLDWRLGPVVDGEASYRRSRYMAPFTDTLSTRLLLDTEQSGSVTVRVGMSPLWRIDLIPGVNQLDTPLPGFPGFKMRETSAAAELDYLGFGRLTSGFKYEYDRGRYEGIVGATKFVQRNVYFTANYKVSGFSSFNASVGYSRRDTQPNPADSIMGTAGGQSVFSGYAGTVGSTSSATGSISYQRQITGKTSASLSLFRSVGSYAAGANPEISTGGAAGVTWKADPKFTVNLSYSLAHDQIQGGLVVARVSNRSDRTQTAALDVRYAALSWLTIRPYFDWSKATSSFTLGNYSQTVVGIDVMARLRW